MFDLTDRPLHWITVEWPGLAPDETDVEGLSVPTKHKIEIRVELVDRAELKTMFPAIIGENPDAEPPSDFDLFKRVVRAWRKIVSGGQPVPFSDDNIRKLLSVPSFCPHFGAAYISAVGGAVEVREKNSPTPPSDGRAAEASTPKTIPSKPTVDASE